MILIDIDMPKTCKECPMNDDNWACALSGAAPEQDRRRKDCPLHEIVIEAVCKDAKVDGDKIVGDLNLKILPHQAAALLGRGRISRE